MKAGENVSALAAELRVRRKLLYEWQQRIDQGRPLRGQGRPKRTAADPQVETAVGAERIRQLEAAVAQLTLENRFFEGALQRIEQLRQAASARSSARSSRRSKR